MASYRNSMNPGMFSGWGRSALGNVSGASFPHISAMPTMGMIPRPGARGYGMMGGGAALIGGAAMLARRHRQRAKSSGGMM